MGKSPNKACLLEKVEAAAAVVDHVHHVERVEDRSGRPIQTPGPLGQHVQPAAGREEDRDPIRLRVVLGAKDDPAVPGKLGHSLVGHPGEDLDAL